MMGGSAQKNLRRIVSGRGMPWGVFLIAVFFAIAICILVSVGTALLLPGSAMEAIWKLYPARRSLCAHPIAVRITERACASTPTSM
jgi:hypothetical protein